MIGQWYQYVLLLEKSFAVLGTVIYLIFAVVIVRQTTAMSRHIKDKFNSVLIAFSYLHLFFSVFLVILAIALL